MMMMKSNDRSALMPIVVGIVVLGSLMLRPSWAFSATTLPSYNSQDLNTHTISGTSLWCGRRNRQRRFKYNRQGSFDELHRNLDHESFLISKKERKKTRSPNIVVQYRDHRFSVSGFEDVLDKVFEKVDKHQAKWNKKLQNSSREKGRRVKKFLMIFFGMGILSSLFPVAFFIGSMIFSIVPMVTFFTLTGLTSFVMPILAPFLLFHVISNVWMNPKQDGDYDESLLSRTIEDEKYEKQEREVTEALNACIGGWNDSLKLLEDQQQKEQKLEFEASNLYYQAKDILRLVDDDESKKVSEARTLLSKRQEILQRKEQVTKIVSEYKNQVQTMGDNVRKLSDQKEELNSKKKNSGSNNNSKSKDVDDPLLRKFREEGIDV